MKTSLMLEYIGEVQDARLALYGGMIDQVSPGLGGRVIGKIRSRQPWVAEITGADPKYGLKRTFLNGNWQRKRSNSTGSRDDVTDDALAVVAPWLQSIVNAGQKAPLPAVELSHFYAVAYVQDGGLLVTVYGPTGPHQPGQPAGADIPLVTFGVAQRSRHSGPLWAMMLANFEHPDGIKQPATPWCAVALHPSIMAHTSSIGWLADFERCVAWAWVTRNAQLGSAK